MLPIVLSSFVGAILTVAILWSQGSITALMCAPLGGSVAGLAAGVTIMASRPAREPMSVWPRSGPIART